jgi:excisionase family DNA binding protein
MNEPAYASTADVASALGVSVSTVKRWVDSGLLPAHKTAGGHRKLLIADVLRLAHEADLPKLNLTLLGIGPTPAEQNDAQRLQKLLLQGDEDGVRGVLCSAYHAGSSVEWIADQLIAPAMHGVGHQWEIGGVDVFHEHRASQTCAAALHELRRIVEQRAAKDRPLAVGGAPQRDFYVLASMLAEIVLLSVGWNVVNLGCNTPMSSFIRAASDLKPRLIWISASYVEDSAAVWSEYPKLYSLAEEMKAAVVLGGQGLDAERLATLPCTFHGENMAGLAAFARSLLPAAPIPKRGRPALQA